MEGRLTLCQYARVTNNGTQFDVLGGGISNMSFPQFPAPIIISVLIECRFSMSEMGRNFPFEIKIIDQDGKAAGPTVGGNINIDPQSNRIAYAAFNIQFLAKNPFSLIYSLLVNGEEKDAVELKVIKAEQRQKVPEPLAGK